MKKRSLYVGLLFAAMILLSSCGKHPSDTGTDTVPVGTDRDESAGITECESAVSTETEHTPVDCESQTASEPETELETELETETLHETETIHETPSETEADTSPLLTGAYASSIERAEHLRGEVNAAYSNNRSAVILSNRSSVLRYPLCGTSEGSMLTTPGGGVYLPALPEIYIKNSAGKTFSMTDTGAGERMNIYRLGSYYYEVHMLDGSTDFEVIQECDIQLRGFRTGNDIDHIQSSTESVSFTVTGTHDPYINSGNLSINADVFNALEITLSTTHASSGQIYVAAGPHYIVTGEQIVSFHTQPDGQPHTYIVPLDDVPDYGGTLSRIRVDIGAAIGEEIRIHSIKAVQIATDAPSVKLDRTFHLYSDKINDVIRLVAKDAVSDLAAVGSVTRIPADTVDALIIKDRNGTHTSLSDVDFDSAEYVGFDIRGVGIYGVILLPDETSGTLQVILADGEYTLTREYARPDPTLAAGESVRSGVRIYTDLNHSFDAFLSTAESERHPLTEVSVTSSVDGARYAGYDVFRGAYRFEIDGHGFPTAFANPDRKFTINACFEGAATDSPIYVYSHTVHGNLECGALLSDTGDMLPIALEVSKNFTGENEEPFYDAGDAGYGEILFPMMIEANRKTEFSIVNLYQNWGNFPLKQISSIQFIAPYYHLSTGSTETNCIAPYYVFGKDLWALPDFRAMSAPLWEGQPQHASVGRLYFLKYTTADGGFFAGESVDNIIDAYGPTYSDIDMNYISDDGKISASYRHLEFPQWDENRTYYTIELTVNDTIEIADFKRDFSFFSFDGRDIFFKKLGYLNEDHECVVTEASTDEAVRFIPLGSQAPYISYFDGHETANLTQYVNFALIIKDAEITIGGQTVEKNFLFREHKASGLNNMALSMDLGRVTLQAGDKFVIHMILLPWGDPSSETDANVRAVREDSCLLPYDVTASVGTVLEDPYLPRILAENGVAEFTLSGGAEASAVRVYGFDHYTGIKVQEKVDGLWVDYVLHSADCDYDGYTVAYDGDGTFSYAFLVNMDQGSRTFRVTADECFPT